jgi:thiamine pyrophosphokinase
MTPVKKSAVVLIGGAFPERRRVEGWLDASAFVIAADSGLYAAEAYGLVPDLIVGDMDSIGDRSILSRFPAEKIIGFPEDKDETDSEIGFRMARELGYADIAIVGGGGGRMDHFIALLALFDRPHHPATWLTDADEILAVDSELTIEAEANETLSFFPAGEGECRMTSTGLRWSLDPLTWKKGDVGVSNRAIGGLVSVTMRTGRLIMVRRYTDSDPRRKSGLSCP